ncbi:MAG: tRNA (adenosine(37)-N6)-threonylcarbamoyltransferase complex dimerization subunit type 1 TsaB [Nannocystaceae bacterium]|nr:tRNA (adenosine(37)-N6)-threonylcarbamoyltransferase complex dimerization subunit type 1 TsaB [bacterium]
MTDASLVLTLDASTPQCVLALGRIEGTTHTLLATDIAAARGRQASAALSQRLPSLLREVGLEPSDLAAVGCGVGPGMFTGVRVAIATAKGIALGLGVPAIGVSTLAAVAATPLGPEAPSLRLALLDARRAEVYAGLYRVDARGVIRQQGDVCAPLEQVLRTLEEPVAAVGPGVEPYAETLGAHARVATLAPAPGPSSEGLWAATASAWPERTEAATLAAVYLRQSYAELGLNPPKRPFVKSPFVD